MSMFFRLLVVSMTLSLITSCAPKRELVPVAPFEGPVTVEALKSHDFFGDIDTLRSEVGVKIYRDGKKLVGLRGVMAYKSPGSLRLWVIDPFGFTLFDMLVDSGYAQAYIPYNNTIFEGELRIFDVPEGASYKIEKKDDGYVLYALRGPHDTPFRTYVYDVALRNLSISGRGNRVDADVAFDEFSGSLPLFIKIQLSNGFAADIRLDDPEIDRKRRDEIFMPIGREGKKVLPFQKLYEMKELNR